LIGRWVGPIAFEFNDDDDDDDDDDDNNNNRSITLVVRNVLMMF